MNQAVLNVIAEMEAVFEKAGEDFAFENIYNEMVPFDDYARDQVSAVLPDVPGVRGDGRFLLCICGLLQFFHSQRLLPAVGNRSVRTE